MHCSIMMYTLLHAPSTYNITPMLCAPRGGKQLTNYTWDFGDNTTNLYVGYEQSRRVNHTYSSPGNYKVIVTAMNAEGRSIGEETVVVLGLYRSSVSAP